MDKDTCEGRIKKSWKSRKAEVKRLLGGKCDEDESIFDFGLSFSWVPPTGETYEEGGYFQYLLSYSGPSDEIRFYDYSRTVYVFLDWFDGAQKDVSSSRTAKELRRVFEDVDALDFAKYRNQDRFVCLGGG